MVGKSLMGRIWALGAPGKGAFKDQASWRATGCVVRLIEGTFGRKKKKFTRKIRDGRSSN